MRIFIAVLVLIFSLQTWTKADDIRDFEIEGMSIGDTLLQYYSKDQIISKSQNILMGGKKYNDWQQIHIENNNELYDRVSLYFKADDKNYIIKKISAKNYYINNIDECYDAQIIIWNEVKKITPNTKKTDLKKEKNPAFPEGDSYQRVAYAYFTDESYIGVGCSDYSKKDTNSRDRLSVLAVTKEYNTWQHSKDKK